MNAMILWQLRADTITQSAGFQTLTKNTHQGCMLDTVHLLEDFSAGDADWIKMRAMTFTAPAKVKAKNSSYLLVSLEQVYGC